MHLMHLIAPHCASLHLTAPHCTSYTSCMRCTSLHLSSQSSVLNHQSSVFCFLVFKVAFLYYSMEKYISCSFEVKKCFGSQYFWCQLENLSAALLSTANRRLSSTKGCLQLKVVFHQMLSSTEGCLPPKVIFHRGSSSTIGCLPTKVAFYRKLSSSLGCLPPKVVFHRRSSTTIFCLPLLKMMIYIILNKYYVWESKL